MEKGNNNLLIILVLCVVASLILSFSFGLIAVNKAKDTSDKLVLLDTKVSTITPTVTAEDVKSIVDSALDSLRIPQSTETASGMSESSKLDRLCELTNGCEYYLISGEAKDDAVSLISSKIPKSKDFKIEFANLVELDRDYLDISTVSLRDSKVSAETKEDKNKDNLNVQLFYKIKYKDEDLDDYSTVYILVTSVLDEGDYDDLSLEIVDRTFKFE